MDDLVMEPVHQPKAFTGKREGPGRTVILYGLEGVQLGYLWASDTGLGFVASSDKGIARVPEFYTAFQAAAKAKAKPLDVFDAWAAKSGQSLYAGPVVEVPDLATLPA
jgi:hypothetical protein